MSESSQPIPLVVFDTGDEVEGEFLYDLSYNELSETKIFWKPYIDWAELEMSVRGIPHDFIPDSREWDWPHKMKQAGEIATDNSLFADWRFFGISYRGYLQGAIAISTTPQSCRAELQSGLSSVGIELVATAPWNIKRFMGSLKRTPFLDQIGRALIRSAIRYSQAAGCEGRLYLYSVPKSETYYDKVCGMVDLGVEYYHGEALRRFEMTSERATAILEETS
jgi:hypothetical protein